MKNKFNCLVFIATASLIFFGVCAGSAAATETNRLSLIFSNYAGSASCRECHPEAFDKWSHSHHAEAERLVQTNLDLRAFVPPRELTAGSQQTIFQWRDGQPQIVAVGLSKKMETNVVARVIGEDPLRQFLTAFPGGRWQVLEAAYDPHRNEWFNVFGNENRQPGEWGHWTGRGMNWNSMCAACHNTRVQKNYDAATDSYHTTMSEPTVSCEACHGPLKPHVDWQKKYGGTNDPVFPKLSRQQTFDTCGSCHARRADLTGDFVPGDNFFDRYELAMVDSSDLFYPDGQVRDEDYEFTAFLGSKMHQAGLTCLDCHPRSLHMAKLHGNQLCLQCHRGGYPKAPVIVPTAHSHHADGSAGNDCIGCHMPVTVYMQRHPRHDHGFTIPDPLLTKEIGVPNACNRCHADQSADWSLKNVEAWYGEKMQRHTRDRARVIARARNGDDTVRSNLVTMLRTEEIPYWRAAAANLLGNWAAEKDVTPALLGALDDTNALVRGACLRALEPLASLETVSNAAQRELADPLRCVRIAAEWDLRASLPEDSVANVELKKFLEVNADQPTGQLQWGNYYFSRGELENARQHFQTAVAWDGFSAPLRLELAVVLSALGQNAEAVAQLQAACRVAPRDAEAHFSLGLALDEQGDTNGAEKELQIAVQLDPRHSRAWYNLGLLQNAAGRPQAALASLARGEQAAPTDPRIPYARATVLYRLNKIAEAKTAAKCALELDPENPAFQRLLEALSQ